MSAVFTYPSIELLVTDMVAGLKPWTKNGLLKILQVNGKAPTDDGFVMLSLENNVFNVEQIERYSYTLAQFTAEQFSTVLPGFALFLAENPANNQTAWNALSGPQQATYSTTAAMLMAQNQFTPMWPTPTQLL